ncbi:hypothetical protein ILUMI_01825 [Ignelater luminosus]|uniref:Voltage-dependent calcium channel alpha-2/delta subunit conserved region domain-containing protein n=1 Tax=Ignelater luminosus TaxID=2038154 RepID=A0A8K0DIX2_IGNLU|nr:hypothetical protein ILUMI_01825 [Ignelater luminosus]
MTMPHRIGVNGYAAILTNNGLVLLHPDHRTEFEGIIKPTFNRVDMTEVEIVDDNNEPRDFNKALLEMRDKIVKQETGYASFKVKTHMDDMRRVILNTRHYFYTKIGPFSLVIAMPDRYGFNRIIYNGANVEENAHNLSGLENTRYWKIHPEWRYCKHYGEKRIHFKSPENELRYFLNRLKQSNWKWSRFCNQGLVKLFILDAKITQWYEEHDTHAIKDKIRIYNVRIVFMATHTGLTRWKSYVFNDTEPEFIRTNNKAIDEIWYKRSIEYNYDSPRSFIYSVPSIQRNISESLITATSSVFAETKGLKAPAAVVGFQFDHSVLNSMLVDLARPCYSADLSCFILDNNAYILVSKQDANVGRFFGSVRPKTMHLLVEDGIYHKTRIFDYQSICYKDPPQPKSRSPAYKVSPFYTNIFGIISWIFTSIMCFIRSALGAGVIKDNPCLRAITHEYVKRAVEKSLPTPCDREFWLYTLKQRSFVGRNTEKRNAAADCLWNYIIQPVPLSNLVLLVVNEKCLDSMAGYNFVSEPVELLYNNLSMPCYIATKNNYTRRRYIACINKHENESRLNPMSKKYCGITWS